MNKLFAILILMFPVLAWSANPSFTDTYGSNGVHTAVTGTGGSQKIAIGFQNGLGDFLANAPGILVNGGSGALSWVAVSTTNLYNSDQFLISTAGVVNIKTAALVTNLIDRVLLLVTNDSGATASFVIGGTDAQGLGILKSVAGGIELDSAGTTTLRTTAGNGIGLNSGSFSLFMLDDLFYPSGSNTVSGGQTTTPFKDWFSKKFTLMGTDSTTNVLTALGGNTLYLNGIPIGGSGFINPTPNFIPYNKGGTNFGDSPLMRLNSATVVLTNNSSTSELDIQNTNANGNLKLISSSTFSTVQSLSGLALASAQNSTMSFSEGTNRLFFTSQFFYPERSNTISGGGVTLPWKDWFSKKFTLMGTDSTTNVLTATNGVLLVNGVPIGGGAWTDDGTSTVLDANTNVLFDNASGLLYISSSAPEILLNPANFQYIDILPDAINMVATNNTGAGGQVFSAIPAKPANVGAYLFDTTIYHTNLAVVEFKNFGTNILDLMWDGSLVSHNGIQNGPFNYGEDAGLDQEVDSQSGIYNFARLSGVQQMITNSQGIISMGIGSGFLRTVIDSTNIVGIGADSFELSYFTNVNDFLAFGQGGDTTFAYDSQRIITIGHESLGDAILHNANNLLFANCFVGAHAELTDSGNFDVSGNQAAQYYVSTNTTDVLALGSLSADHAIADGSAGLTYIGKSAGANSKLTNSENVTFIGTLSGQGIEGTFENFIFTGNNTLAMGSDVVGTWNPNANDFIAGIHSVDSGESHIGQLYFKAQTNSTAADYTFFRLIMSADGSQNYLTLDNEHPASYRDFYVQSDDSGLKLILDDNGKFTELNVAAPDGSTAYTFDTSVIHTSADLAGIKNFGTNRWALGFSGSTVQSGTLTTSDPGNGSGAWSLGKVVTGAVTSSTTNYVEVKIDGAVVKLVRAN